MIKFDLKNHRREVVGAIIVLFLLIGGISVFKYTSFNSGFEIVDDLGGNIFPSAILSVATTDAQVITPSDSMYLGNPKSCIAVRVKSRTAYSRVRIEVADQSLPLLQLQAGWQAVFGNPVLGVLQNYGYW